VLSRQLTPKPSDSRQHDLLASLLNDRIVGLLPVRSPIRRSISAMLDVAQREAVARALRTPDICVIQGFHGTGKSHVLAELLAHTAAGGESTLLVSPTASGIDRVLELIPKDGICAIRCLGPDEEVAALSPAARCRVLSECQRRFHEQTLASARQADDDSCRDAE